LLRIRKTSYRSSTESQAGLDAATQAHPQNFHSIGGTEEAEHIAGAIQCNAAAPRVEIDAFRAAASGIRRKVGSPHALLIQIQK
jgi:hypothetical protein